MFTVIYILLYNMDKFSDFLSDYQFLEPLESSLHFMINLKDYFTCVQQTGRYVYTSYFKDNGSQLFTETFNYLLINNFLQRIVRIQVVILKC